MLVLRCRRDRSKDVETAVRLSASGYRTKAATYYRQATRAAHRLDRSSSDTRTGKRHMRDSAR